MADLILAQLQTKRLLNSICHKDQGGTEYWYGRELMSVMLYKNWHRFIGVIKKAEKSIRALGVNVSENFYLIERKTKGRTSFDYKLSEIAVNEIQKFCSNHLKPACAEIQVSIDLSNKISGSLREVKTIAGKIDVLTRDEIIEVKSVGCWKAALGQILVYGHYYPAKQKRIHLFGHVTEEKINLIRSHCQKFDVIVTWEK